MTNFTIDLRAKFVSPASRVWRLFPGAGYAFLQPFREHGIVFLDMPALVLPEGPLPAEIPMLRERVLLSRATGDWRDTLRRLTRQDRLDELPPAPSTNLADYTTERARANTTDVGSIRAMFSEAKVGDIVIVPDQLQNRRLHIAEFLEPPERRRGISVARYGDSVLLARQVRWFPPVDEGTLPIGLTGTLRIPNPMTLIGRSFYHRIFDEIYKTYYTGEHFSARFTTDSLDFTVNDSFDFNFITKIVSIASAAVEKVAAQGIKLDPGSVLSESVPEDYNINIAYSIHSPGFLDLKAARITPVIVAALFSLMTIANADQKPDPSSINIVNSAKNARVDPCFAEINAGVIETLNMMNYDLWKTACKRAQSLHNVPQMRSGPEVRTKP